jgi:glycosyltransferase involved in cell wall biosynthesis
MRIGFDATALPAEPVGAGRYIIRLVRALAAHSAEHELVVFVQDNRRVLIDTPLLENVRWIETPEISPARRLVWEQTTLPRLARRSGIDLLHSPHYTRPLSLSCASVVTFHDMTFLLYPQLHTRTKRLFFPWMMRMSARRADAIIADSDSTRRDAMKILQIPAEKIVTVPLGIGEEFHPVTDVDLLEDCRRRYNLPQTFLLYVGLVEPRKNLPLLLEAYARLSQQEDAPPLIVVGRFGWMVEDVFRQIEALHLQERVHFSGYIPDQDLPLVYNLAQSLLYPSRYEGFGFPPLEAMACGTPVITTAVSAMQDQVGDAGLLIPPQDELALFEAMRRLSNDRVLREDLSVRGRRQAEKFTWNQTARKTLNIYQQVARSRQRQ